MENKLIAALGTAQGTGGIAIIRLSGSGSWELIKKIFLPKTEMDWENLKGYTLRYGKIQYKGRLYDEVLVALMKAGGSYTGEEMAEIHCHGGSVSGRRILELLFSLGAALAEAGEFTKRAFLNGRLDLSQAEAVIETIEAGSERDIELSLRRLEGNKGKEFLSIRQELLALIAEAEAVIDFPEDGLDDAITQKIAEKSRSIIDKLDMAIKRAEEGRIYKEGLKTVILGRTNVGKSSLLNALLREERASVTDIPGTTRDTIEEKISLRGIPLIIVDTAGIRETADPVEKMGVNRSREALDNCDLVLAVFDAGQGFTSDDKEILEHLKGKKAVALLNKCDIRDTAPELEAAVAPLPYIYISAKEGLNLESLGEIIEKMFLSGAIKENDSGWVGNIRHKEIFLRSKHHLKEVLAAIEAGAPLDFQVIDLRSALEVMGEISGETISSEIIDRIFSDFCIGK
ncbi:MAG: tRNA uridine-5-carboxymethylaminomethyl(34) synthesis GTPase MnmE [Bacillota bacterium]|nr:tRNA uridine-5-carboxymethylaminomethyl(34) synthesis GTPase MnmE [Bacillota bacterium]